MAATPSAQYSLTIRVEIEHKPGMLGQVATAIGQAGGTIGSVDLVKVDDRYTLRDGDVDGALDDLLADRSLLTRRLLGSAPEEAMLHALDAAGLPVPREIGGQ